MTGRRVRRLVIRGMQAADPGDLMAVAGQAAVDEIEGPPSGWDDRQQPQGKAPPAAAQDPAIGMGATQEGAIGQQQGHILEEVIDAERRPCAHPWRLERGIAQAEALQRR